jgi:hypothetical protein
VGGQSIDKHRFWLKELLRKKKRTMFLFIEILLLTALETEDWKMGYIYSQYGTEFFYSDGSVNQLSDRLKLFFNWKIGGISIKANLYKMYRNSSSIDKCWDLLWRLEPDFKSGKDKSI